ncbi:MAG TPA: GIY-YIG nuclease family protein [Pantanalinema sp.]
MPRHFVYLVRCADGTLYTGYSTDVARRVSVHNSGKGAKYTRSRLPVVLVAHWEYPSRGEALSAEHRIRRMRPAAKLALLPGDSP